MMAFYGCSAGPPGQQTADRLAHQSRQPHLARRHNRHPWRKPSRTFTMKNGWPFHPRKRHSFPGSDRRSQAPPQPFASTCFPFDNIITKTSINLAGLFVDFSARSFRDLLQQMGFKMLCNSHPMAGFAHARPHLKLKTPPPEALRSPNF